MLAQPLARKPSDCQQLLQSPHQDCSATLQAVSSPFLASQAPTRCPSSGGWEQSFPFQSFRILGKSTLQFFVASLTYSQLSRSNSGLSSPVIWRALALSCALLFFQPQCLWKQLTFPTRKLLCWCFWFPSSTHAAAICSSLLWTALQQSSFSLCLALWSGARTHFAAPRFQWVTPGSLSLSFFVPPPSHICACSLRYWPSQSQWS